MDRKASIKSITADTVTIAGYGVVFGGSDLDGETFTKDTDFMLDLVPKKLTLYDHGTNHAIKTTVIGRIPADNIKVDEFGLWIEAELARSNEYTAYIMALAEKGVLGWSSGSVSHLVERSGKTIKSWPIIEFSLTPTPAEPRTLGAEVMKSLAEFDAGIKALLQVSTDAKSVDIQPEGEEGEAGQPEDVAQTSATATESNNGKSTSEVEQHNGAHIMNEEIKRMLANLDGRLNAALDKLHDELLAKLRKLWDEAPVVAALDGARVRLPGFAVPLETDGQTATRFLLVPYIGACIHVPPPPLNQTVLVEAPTGARIRHVFDPVWVTGRLTVQRATTELANAGYTLTATEVKPYGGKQR